MDLVCRLVKAFPNGGANAGAGYLGALAATLVTYPRMVATKCCEPVHGVARETRFLPTVADLVGWCERETEAMRGPVDREDRDAMLRRQAQARADDEAHWEKLRPKRETLEELRAKHGPNWGLRTVEQPSAKRSHLEAIQKANDRALVKIGGTISAGIPISDALRKSIEEHRARALAGTEGV